MKPLSHIFFSKKKTSTFCLHRLESRIKFKTRFSPGLRIYNLHNSSVLPVKQTKLFHKLLKSRAKYEDARCRVISESLLGLDCKGKVKGKKNIQPIAAQRVKTIIQLVTAIDRGGDLSTKKVQRLPCSVKSPFRIFTRSQNKFTHCCVCPEDQKPMSSEVRAEKPRRKTNIFLRRIVKKSNNRTTCVQVEAIESIDDDDCSPNKKEPCDGKELLKSLKHTLPKECRKVVQSCPKIDSSNSNDPNKFEKLKTCIPCIAKCCFKKKSNGIENPPAQKKSKSVACQGKISLRRKSAQAKISIFKKGTCTESPPGVACYAKLKVKKKSGEKIGNKSRNSSRASNLQKNKGKEKKGLKQQAETKDKKSKKNKGPQQTSDSCTCNKVTQTKDLKKKTKPKSKNDTKPKESVNSIKNEKKKKGSVSSNNIAKKNKRSNTSKPLLRSTDKKKKRSAQRTKSETQVKKTSKCLPCNKCSNAGNCCELVNQNNRNVNTGQLKNISKSCAALGKSRNKGLTTKLATTEKSKPVGKENAETKRKQERKQKAEKEPKSDKKSKGEPPKKCQLVRLGSSFSFQIEFYKDKSKVKPEKPERRKEKRDKYEGEKGEKPEKKRKLKNKYSVTKLDKPTKTVTKSTKTKRTCCSMCYFAKVYRLKPKFRPEFAASPSNKTLKLNELSESCCNLDNLKKTWPDSQVDTHSNICLKTFSVDNFVRDCYFENHYSPKSIYTQLGNNNLMTKDFVTNYSNLRFLPVNLYKKIPEEHILSLNTQNIDNSFLLALCFSILQLIQHLNVRTVILNFSEFQSLCFLLYFLLKIHNFTRCVLYMKRYFIYSYILVCTLSGKGF